MLLSKRKTTFMNSENNNVFSSDTPKYHLWAGTSQNLTLHCFFWITCSIQWTLGFLNTNCELQKWERKLNGHIYHLILVHHASLKFGYISLILTVRYTFVRRNNSRIYIISVGVLFNIMVHIRLCCYSCNYWSIVASRNS